MTYYQKGTYFERLTQHWLERNNYYVMRSAGSHGIFDLLAIAKSNVINIECWKEQHFIIGIQLKSTSNQNFNDSYISNYLKGKEFAELIRTTWIQNANIAKYVFIYNRENRKEPPIIYWWNRNIWEKIQ